MSERSATRSATTWTLGAAHEIGVTLACASSFVVVLLGGELPAFAWLLALAPFVSALLVVRRIHPPALSATLVGVASLALAVATLARGGLESSVLAGTQLLMGLLTARLLVRRTPAHDLQALSLSLLLVLAGSVLNVKITYLFVFVLYAVAAVWALSTRQLLAGAVDDEEREHMRKRADVVTPAFFVATAGVSVAVLATSAVVFALFPRVGFGEIGAFFHKESRLPSSVGLRGDPRLGGGNEVVARARGVPHDAFLRGLYLRGSVYDVINFDGFAQSELELDPVDKRKRLLPGFPELAESPNPQARYELTIMPVVGDTLLSLGGVYAIRPLGGGNSNPNVAMGVGGKSELDEEKALAPLVSALRYDVVGSIAAPGFVPKAPKRAPPKLEGDARARWLALPTGWHDRNDALPALVTSIVGTATTPSLKAGALREFFLGKFVYTQDAPRDAASPLVTFLFDDRQGHCEYFASAYAMLLRGAGVPSRVVGGFQGGAWDDVDEGNGIVVFAERNAHAWVEWWDDDAGWIVDDATPLATATREQLTGFSRALELARRFWDDRVLDYSLQDQSDAFDDARRAARRINSETPPAKALLVVVPVALVAAIALWRRRQRRARTDGAKPHPLALAILDVVSAPASATVREAVESYDGSADVARALSWALAKYEADRFGGARLSREDVAAAAKALRVTSRRAGRHASARKSLKNAGGGDQRRG